jgi:hypothetical protein
MPNFSSIEKFAHFCDNIMGGWAGRLINQDDAFNIRAHLNAF